MADLRAMIQALTPGVPLPQGINTATGAMGIDAATDVLVYVPPDVEVFNGSGGPFLPLSGAVAMTGPLILANATPTQPLEAASKSYVDTSIAGVLNNPVFTGTVIVPTLPPETSNNQAASTAFVHAVVAEGGTFVDAPADGFAYGRLNHNWAQVLPLNGGGTITPAYLRLNGPAGTARPIVWSTNLSTRWQLIATADGETGNSQGSNFALYSYADNGAYIGSALSINRASGPQGQGGPYIYQLAPWRQITGGIGWPNGVIGNRQDIGQADRQPVVAMPANPFATTAGSPVITVNWPGSCNPASGWIGENAFGTQTWLLFAGATDVGGITPNGWLLAQSIVDNDHFTVRWTANATDTVAAGGGSAITVRPSYCTTTNRVTTEITFGGSGFPVQTAELYAASPEFPPSVAGLPRYEHRWHWTVGPNDPTGATPWNLSGIEWDLTNRGHDYGYQPNIYGASQPTVAFWVGPVSIVPQFASGGGTPVNWNSVYTVFSGQNDGAVTGVYQAFTAQPNSLVGQHFDPTGHGGVGVDLYGSYSGTPVNNPFSTNTGSPVVFVQMWQGEMIGQANGDQVYIPNVYTINGVTFGGGVYTMANVNTATGSFAIVGLGNATATGSGGGSGVVMNFLDFAPYAPMQTWGLYQHGITTAPGSYFLSGGIIETQPGNGILWSDGVRGTASINAQVDGPDIDLLLTPAGLGRVTVAANNITLFAGITPSDTQLNLFGYQGFGSNIYFRIGNVPRWGIFSDQSAETGGNAGSNFAISRYSDTGNFIGNGLAINRATGAATMGGSLTLPGGVIIDQSGTTNWAQVQFLLNPANNNAARIYSTRGANGRWNLFVGDTDPESGANSGTNFQIQGVLDNGTTLPGVPALKIIRASNQVNMGGALTVTGAVTAGGVTSSGTILATGTNAVQAGQPGAGNALSLAPGAPGSGFATVSASGIDGNVDLRLVAQGTGVVRAMSPLTLVSGLNGLLTMQPGQAIRWSDGTNTSSINVGTGANADMTLNPTGSGRLLTGANLFLIWGSAGSENALDIRGGASQFKTIYFRTGNSARWTFTSDANPESGGNANSNLSIGRFGDAGNFLGAAMNFNRATGNVTLSNSLGVNGAAAPGRPTVTGSRTDGSALLSLLTALVSFGFITDSTTA